MAELSWCTGGTERGPDPNCENGQVSMTTPSVSVGNDCDSIDEFECQTGVIMGTKKMTPQHTCSPATARQCPRGLQRTQSEGFEFARLKGLVRATVNI